jgi:hypothetical protein
VQAMMARCLELLVVHRLRLGEIADVDQVRKDKLVHEAVRVGRVVDGQDGPSVDVVDVVRNETEAAELEIDLAKQRLTLVERQETNFGVDGDRALQALTTALEHRELGALHVDFQHVQSGDL